MKLIPQFSEFLKETVNLNQTRINLLDGNVKAIQSFIRQSTWRPKICKFYEQGSWAHNTIIRPVDGDEFDADLLVMVDPVEGWTAKDYIVALGEVFSDSATYGEKTKIWDYCVTITYQGERKVDIAPCVVSRLVRDQIEVCNRATDQFERSEPVAYTQWMRERNNFSGSNSFRKVTRLLKYLRDIKRTFTCPSVLLTTLLGMQINWLDKDTEEFSDVPTSLRTLMRRLDEWLQLRPIKPRVENPNLPSEDFAASWTDTQYSNFRSFIHKYRGWVDDAYNAEGKTDSVVAWRRIFGDAFAKGETVKASTHLAEGISRIQSLLVSTAAHVDELVDAVRDFGVSILPASFYRIPHMRQPTWPQATTLNKNVQVFATWQISKNAIQGRAVKSGDILSRQGGLWFDVGVNGGLPLPAGFRVQWRITNTGVVALARNSGRGEFYVAQRGNRRWEELQYRGVHIAEAFIIRSSDNVLVGQSPPFNVVIE
ncbi:hypothetical protein K2X14_16350 [Acetobacter sp. TBRC 12305]|uniref:Adenylyl/Guanylyl and SMODS C-terminal sensor domain-containing protein n=1 Tax=Acetobacter garciniae TaxID=2817435 RepID=A0A939KRX5_9PROT|nr:nucleotidyltransferase [Acetobacter garciniae]MBO1326381.1 hypothetical protein [Acetobacter garciniae]MBX0346402.1 hypothetical protein [Acetobacter garciniae]